MIANPLDKEVVDDDLKSLEILGEHCQVRSFTF